MSDLSLMHESTVDIKLTAREVFVFNEIRKRTQMMFLLAPKRIFAAKQLISSYSTHLHLNTITFSYLALTVFDDGCNMYILVSFPEAPEIYLFGTEKTLLTN